MAGIDDIIQLEPFSDDAFFENIEKADKKRTETIDKVNEIDYKWTTEYAKSEEDQAAVAALMEQLKVSSTRGGVVSLSILMQQPIKIVKPIKTWK
ncbi:hypothetical protein KEH51_00785 [[Brevibacterium] frigoritolerans]|uniref:LXG domain-containing protein n=1 Tax=Peribacillus frigoritolerans TaxID=450367 RepID=A0A941J1V0_9BACI|nr:hypothetical protein [Peribacillus frigoritolerans]